MGTILLAAAPSAYAATTVYYSVGTKTGDFKIGSPTLTISGGVATFSLSQPLTVGVGDLVNINNSLTVAISGRVNSSTFAVQSLTGSSVENFGTGTTCTSIKRAFNSLGVADNEAGGSAWLNTMDLVTNNYQLNFVCYADGVDSTNVVFNGWTTGADNYIRIYTPTLPSEVGVSQRHIGTWGNGYRMSEAEFFIADNYVRVDGLSIYSTTGSLFYTDSSITGAAEFWFSNCFGWYGGTSWPRPFGIEGPGTIKIWNCIAVNDSTDGNSQGILIYHNDAVAYIYNCTVLANAGGGIEAGLGTAYVKNCIASSTTSGAYAGAMASVTYSASKDDTADNWGSPSTNLTNQNFIFVAAVSEDYHLQSSSPGVNQGTSLAADLTIAFSTDIDGQTRPFGAQWDIGADEFTTSGVVIVWDSAGGNNNASTATNWDPDSSLDKTSEATVASTNDAIVWDVDSVKALTVSGSYSGTITQSTDLSVPDTMLISTGTWDMAGYDLSLTNLIVASGATFDISTGDLTIGQSLSLGNGAIFSNTGANTTYFSADDHDNTISSGTIVDDVIFDTTTAATWTLLGDLTIVGDLTVSSDCTLDMATFDLTVTGSVVIPGRLDPGQGCEVWFGRGVNMTGGSYEYGTSSTYFYGSNDSVATMNGKGFNNVYVNKTALGTNLSISDLLSIAGDVRVQGGTFFTNSELTLMGNLTVSSGAAFTHRGAGQTIFFNPADTIGYHIMSGGTVTWQGTSGNELRLRSTIDNSPWTFDSEGTKNISYVNVKDSDASMSSALINPTNSTNAGNTTNWFSAATAIYYSVGTNTSALYSGLAAATSGAMTLSVSGVDYIGVGDEIRQGDNRFYISGRTSATVFSIQDSSANGGTPGDTNITFSSQDIQIYRAFNSLTAAEAGSIGANYLNTADLSVSDYQLNWPCYADGPDTDPASVIIAGYSTNPTCYINIYTPTASNEVGISQRHKGIEGTGYVLRPIISDPVALFTILYVQDEFVYIEGIEIDGSNVTNAQNFYAVAISTRDIHIDSCMIHGIQNSAGGASPRHVIGLYNFSRSLYFSNSFIYDITNISAHANSAVWGLSTSGIIVAYNNTIVDIKNTASTSYAYGVEQFSDVATVSNNYVGDVNSTGGSEACFVGTFNADSTNNVSSDNTATTASGLSGGVGLQSTYANYFHNVNAGFQDLHLKNDSNGLWGSYGADLDTDISIAMTLDIDAESRDGSNPDIGADEYTAAYEGIGAFAGTLFVWDSGNIENMASKSANWDHNTKPGKTGKCAINTTSDTIDWDLNSVNEITLSGSYSGRVAQSTNLTISNSLNVETGRWDMVASSLSVANLIVANGAAFDIGAGDLTIGQSLALGSTTRITADTLGNTVYFYANDANNTISGGVIVDDVIFKTNGAATWTLLSSLTIDGNLTIQSGCTFDLDAFSLSCSGALVVQGTLDASASQQVWIGGAVDGSSGTILGSASILLAFYASKEEESWTFLDNMILNGDLTISSPCTVDLSTYDITVSGNTWLNGVFDPGQASEAWFGRNVNMTGGTFEYGTSSAYFYSSDDSIVTMDGEALNDIYVKKTALSDNVTISDLLSTAGDLMVEGGTFFTNSELTLMGNLTVSSGAEFASLGAGMTIFFDPTDSVGYHIDAGGTITLQGDSVNELYLRSAVDNSQWVFDSEGTKNISYVNVKDSDASMSSAMIGPTFSTNAGNTINWFVVPAATAVYYSVGTNAGDLSASGTTTLTVSGGVMTFNTAQNDNIGVGDLVNINNTLTVSISARANASKYTIQSLTGSGISNVAINTSCRSIKRAFNSLFSAQANLTYSGYLDTDDLVAGNYQVNFACYADGVDTTAVAVNGWTTGADNYIRIYTPTALTESGVTQRHNGTWGNGYRRTAYISINDEYVRLDGISIKQSSSTITYFVTNYTGTGDIQISNCFGWYSYPTAIASNYDVYDIYQVGPTTFKLWNCIGINDNPDTACEALNINDGDVTAYVYNCTLIANAGQGFMLTSGNAFAKNCLAYSALGSAFLSWGTMQQVLNCASNDDTADDWGSPSTNLTNQDFIFIDEDNYDYHLASHSPGVDQGTSLLADLTNSFMTDIDKQTRPIGSAWDIGADETGFQIFYSVGTFAGNLETGTSTLTIENNVATFNTSQADRVGVGDVINYGTALSCSIVGRTSSAVYTIRSLTGSGHSNVTGATVNYIKRAFNSLYAAEDRADDAGYLGASDLVTGNYQLNLVCYADGDDTAVIPTGGADTGVWIDGWTTGPSNYIRVYTPVGPSEVGTSQRHNGTAGTGYVYKPIKAAIATDYWTILLLNSEEYVRIEGIEIDGSSVTNAGILYGLYSDSDGNFTSSDIRLDSVIVHALTNSVADNNADNNAYMVGIAARDSNYKISNCLVYDIENRYNGVGATHITGIYAYQSACSFYYYNNTIYDVKYTGSIAGSEARGINNLAGTVYAKNNFVGYVDAVVGTEPCYNGTFASGSTNNASSDATAPGTNAKTGLTNYSSYFENVTPGSEDLHLSHDTSNSYLIDAGANLSTDGNLVVTTDIDGGARPFGPQFDIGADEWGAGSVKTVYYSVGTKVGDFKIGSPTITVSGNLATFSLAQPLTMGVGDFINISNTLTVAVSGRVNSSTFMVQSLTGSGVDNVTALTACTSIKRAFNSLSKGIKDVTTSGYLNTADLVTSNYQLNLVCYADGADTVAAMINGYTTSFANCIKIYTPTSASEVGVSQRHSGKWDSNGYRLEVMNLRDAGAIDIRASYVSIEGLQISIEAAGGVSYMHGILYNAARLMSEGELRVSHSIFKQTGTDANQYHGGVWAGGSNLTFKIWGNIFYDFMSGTTRNQGINIELVGTAYIYNNTIVNSEYGIYVAGSGAAVYAMNNLVQNCSDGYDSPIAPSSDYNISDIAADAPNATFGGGEATVVFVDEEGKDFHLAASDTAARDQGVDLSSDVTLAFSTDIDGGTRPFGPAWDIGADEYGVNPNAQPVFYSVGTKVGDFKIGAPTLTISGGVLTFSLSQPLTMGVGDVVNYGSNISCSIVARTNSRVYTVRSLTGSGMSNVGGATTVNYISRAFNSLAEAEDDSDDVGFLGAANLVTGKYQLNWACYADGPITSTTLINGYTLDATHYINIFTPYADSQVGVSQRHNGTWLDSAFNISVTGGSSAIDISDPYIRIEGLQIEILPTAPWVQCIYIANAEDLRISNNVFTKANDESSVGIGGINVWDNDDSATPHGIKIWNNIFYNFDEANNFAISSEDDVLGFANELYIYSNTIYDCFYGIVLWTPARNDCFVKNNVVLGCADSFFGTFESQSTNNAYSEGADPGSNGVSLTGTFATDYFFGTRDFHINKDAPYVDEITDSGANLSTDVTISFINDMDNETRPEGAAWDIGADEFLTSYGGGIHYIWDSGATDNYASIGENWNNDIAPFGPYFVTINTTADQINWDIMTNLAELTMSASFSGEVTQSEALSVAGLMKVGTGQWHTDDRDLSVSSLVVGPTAMMDVDDGGLTIGQSLSLTGAAVLTATNGGAVMFYANDTDNTISGATISSDVYFKTSGTSTWTLFSDLVIDGDLTIASGCTFDLVIYNLTVTGTLRILGTLDASAAGEVWIGRDINLTGGQIDYGTSTTFLYGTSSRTITSGGASFNNVFVRNGNVSTVITLADALTAAGNLTVNSGTLDVAARNLTVAGNVDLNANASVDGSDAACTVFVAGNWDSTGGTFVHGSGTVAFFGNANSTVTMGGRNFNKVRVTKTAITNNVTISDTLSVAGDIFVTGGTFFTNNDLTMFGNLTVSSGAAFTSLGAGKTIFFNDADTVGYWVNAGAAVTLHGASGNLLYLRSTTNSNQWNFIQLGTKDISYVNVKDSNATGSTDWINPPNSFNAGNTIFWFPSGGHYIWDGSGTGDLASTDENWLYDLAPGDADFVTIDATADPIGWDLEISLAELSVSGGFTGEVTQSTGLSVSNIMYVSVRQWHLGTEDLSVSSLVVGRGAVLDIDSGDLTISQSLSAGPGAVISTTGGTTTYFRAPDHNNTISGNTTIKDTVIFWTPPPKTATWTLQGDLTIDGNLSINADCTLDCSIYTLTVTGNLLSRGRIDADSTPGVWFGGNVNMTGGQYVYGTGTTFFYGTPSRTITSHVSSFNNLIVRGGNVGTVITLADPLTAAGNLTLNSGTFDVGVQDLTVAGNLDLNANASLDGSDAACDVFMGGSWDSAGGNFVNGLGKVRFFGSSDSFVTLGSEEFTTLYVNKNALANNVSLSQAFSISGDVVVNGGTFFINQELSLMGNLTVTSGGGFTHLGAGKMIFFNSDDSKGYFINSGATVRWQGASGNELYLRSDLTGSQWIFDCEGTKHISYVNVQDSDASRSSVAINPNYSTDNGNNINWFVFQQPPTGNGDIIAIYREVTGVENMTTAEQVATWDTTVRQDSCYEMQTNRADARLLQSGRYLAIYNFPGYYNGADNNRQEIQTELNIGNTSFGEFGHATGYIRWNTNTFYSWQAAGTVFDHIYDDMTLSNNDLSLSFYNTDSATQKGVIPVADTGGLMLLRLKDEWYHSRYSEVGGTQILTASNAYDTFNWDAITLDTNDENDGVIIDHSTVSNTENIILHSSGHYLVTYSVWGQTVGTTRTSFVTRLTFEGSEIDATRGYAYLRGTESTNDERASFTGIVYVGSHGILKLEASEEGEAATNVTIKGAAITVTKLPDTAPYFRSVLSSDLSTNGAEFAVTWPTPVEEDSDAFSYAGPNPTRITIPAGITNRDYIFFSTQYNYRGNATNTTRLTPRWRWRENGSSLIQYGMHGSYNRGDQSTTGSYAGGSSGGYITSLTTANYVEVMNVDTTTTVDQYLDIKANRAGVQGCYIPGLYAEDVFVWSHEGADANWLTPENWGGGELDYPREVIHNVRFDGTSTDACTDNTAVTVGMADIRNAYTGTITLGAALTISEKLSVGGNATVTMGSYDLRLNGDLSNDGTISSTTGRLIFKANDHNNRIYSTKDIGAAVLIETGATGTWTLARDLSVAGDLTISSNCTLDLATYTLSVSGSVWINGTLDADGAGATVYVGDNWNSASGTFRKGTSTVWFNRGNDSTVTSGLNDFYGIGVKKTALSDAVTLSNVLSIAGDIRVNSGRFWPATDLSMFGNLTVSSGASFTCRTAGADIFFNDDNAVGYWINAGGLIELTGSGGNEIVLRSDSNNDQWSFFDNGNNSIAYVDVKDSNASGGNTVIHSNSLDSGNCINWDFPLIPTYPLAAGEYSGGYITDDTPDLSAIYEDAVGTDTATAFEIEVDDNADFSSPVWDTGKDDFTDNGFSDAAEGTRCSNIPYNYDAGGAALNIYGHYYWRIRFWDQKNNRGTWCATQEFVYDPTTASRYLITFDHTTLDHLDVR